MTSDVNNSVTLTNGYSEADPRFGRKVVVMIGDGVDTPRWIRKPMALGELIATVAAHREGPKEGMAVVLGDLAGGRRKKDKVRAIYALGLDLDDSPLTGLELDAKMAELGFLAVRATTHSHYRKGERHRIIIPLAEPFRPSDYPSVREAERHWRAVLKAVGARLGVEPDKACCDLARAYYLPRHDAGAPWESTIIGGALLDLAKLSLSAALARPERKPRQVAATTTGVDLAAWGRRRGDTFLITEAIRGHCPEVIRNEVVGGLEIECPNDAEHSNAGDPDDRACLVRDAPDNPEGERFVVSCRHEHCQRLGPLDMLGMMVEAEWMPRDALDDDAYHVEVEGRDPTPGGKVAIFDFDDEAALIAALNQRVALVFIGSDDRYVLVDDPAATPMTRRAAEARFAPYKLWVGDEKDPKPKPGFKRWLESPDRLAFDSLVFQPDPAKVKRGELNLFTGFEVAPHTGGTYRLFAEHVRENVTGGDRELEDFVWDFAADLVQRPGRKPGVALLLRGEKGIGKSTFSSVLAALIGERYCMTIDSAEGFTGRFSGHLEHKLLLVVEEAFHAGNPAHESRLKSLVTGHRVSIEPKHRQAYDAPSYCRIVMTTNADHVVPATGGERRYVCLDVKPHRRKDGAFFRAMMEELEGGGYEALMADLMARDLKGRDFSNPPMTAALSDQIRLSMKPDEAWWASILETGHVPFTRSPDDLIGELEWPLMESFTVSRSHLLASFQQNAPGFRGPPSPVALGLFIAKACPEAEKVKIGPSNARVNGYRFPPRAHALAAFLMARSGLTITAESEAAVVESDDPYAHLESEVASMAAYRGRRRA